MKDGVSRRKLPTREGPRQTEEYWRSQAVARTLLRDYEELRIPVVALYTGGAAGRRATDHGHRPRYRLQRESLRRRRERARRATPVARAHDHRRIRALLHRGAGRRDATSHRPHWLPAAHSRAAGVARAVAGARRHDDEGSDAPLHRDGERRPDVLERPRPTRRALALGAGALRSSRVDRGAGGEARQRHDHQLRTVDRPEERSRAATDGAQAEVVAPRVRS